MVESGIYFICAVPDPSTPTTAATELTRLSGATFGTCASHLGGNRRRGYCCGDVEICSRSKILSIHGNESAPTFTLAHAYAFVPRVAKFVADLVCTLPKPGTAKTATTGLAGLGGPTFGTVKVHGGGV